MIPRLSTTRAPLVGALSLGCVMFTGPEVSFAGVVAGASFVVESSIAPAAIRDSAVSIRADLDTFALDDRVIPPMLRGAAVADRHAVVIIVAADTIDSVKVKRIRAASDTIRRVLTDSIIRRPVYTKLTAYARRAIDNALRKAARIDSLASTLEIAQPPPDTVVTPPPDTAVTPTPTPTPAPDPTMDGPAELPRSSVDVTYPPGSRRALWVVGRIQPALDSAKCGDDVIVPAGVYAENLNYRQQCSSGWIVLRGEGLTVPSGSRLTPSKAVGIPKILTAVAAPVLRVEDGASGLRIVGLEISAAPSLTVTYSLVTFGDGDEATLSAVPSRLIVDRSYIHGHATLDVRRGVYLNCAQCAVVDSWISEIHTAFDGAAVWAINGPGPILVQNNTLEASGENVMVGGGQLRIAGVQPSDVTIRGNHIVKPLAWFGTQWQTKNLLEFKTCVRCLIEGNVFENLIASTQPGYAIVWTATDQGFGTPWATVADVTMRWNEVRNVLDGWNLMGWVNATGAFTTSRVSVHDNLLGPLVAGQRIGVVMQRGVSDVALARNTFAGADYGVVLTGDAAVTGFVWSSNLLAALVEIHYTNPPSTSAPGMVSSGNVMVAPGSVLPATPGVDRAALASRLAGVVIPP